MFFSTGCWGKSYLETIFYLGPGENIFLKSFLCTVAGGGGAVTDKSLILGDPDCVVCIYLSRMRKNR
jgi:hypothetical protein